MTEIILVRYKLPFIENECIKSVLDNTKDYHLTVYDNGPKNQNLGSLWNDLICASKADNICLLNTDTLVEPNWLTNLEALLDSDKSLGAVGPVTNETRNCQRQEKSAGWEYTPENEMLSGFCLLFPKRVWEEVKFPEDYGFYGQETEFLKRVQKKGYKQAYNKNVFVFHYGSASAKEAEKRGEMNMDEERKIAREKYQSFLKDQ